MHQLYPLWKSLFLTMNIHPYYLIPPYFLCFFFGIYCLFSAFFICSKKGINFYQNLSRRENIGICFLLFSLIWVLLLLAPFGQGIGMNLAEFNPLKAKLKIFVIFLSVAIIIWVKEFLFVRSIGLLLLLASTPILNSVFLKENPAKLVLVITAYAMILKGMIFIAFPYLYRDCLSWLMQETKRLSFARYYALVLAILFFWAGISLRIS